RRRPRRPDRCGRAGPHLPRGAPGGRGRVPLAHAQARGGGGMNALAAELRKLPAFLERDLYVAWSYRAAFIGDAVGLLTQMLLFAAVGLMVDESVLPAYGGQPTTYVEFVSVGMA